MGKGRLCRSVSRSNPETGLVLAVPRAGNRQPGLGPGLLVAVMTDTAGCCPLKHRSPRPGDTVFSMRGYSLTFVTDLTTKIQCPSRSIIALACSKTPR